MAKKPTNQSSMSGNSSHERKLLVLFESLGDQIKLVAAGNLMLNERMESMENKIDLIKTEMGTLKEDVGTLKEDVGTLKEDVGTLKENVVILKEDVGTLKENVVILKEEMREMREEMYLGFKGVIAEIAKDEDEIAKKADKKDLLLLEKRTAKLEAAR